VGVGASKSKVIDTDEALIFRPRSNTRWNLDVLLIEWDRAIYLLKVDAWQNEALFEHQGCLNDGDDAACVPQITNVGLYEPHI
jgi:hypothetical protein